MTGFIIDIYTPSLPAMATYFGVNKSWVQLTITVELIAYGLFHTVVSTLAGMYGQRRILIPGLALLTLVSFLIPVSPNIIVLLILRFFQGIFICAPAAISKNLITMHYEGAALRRNANYLMLIWALGPIFAPTIGGYLQDYFDWQASFLFIAVYSLLCTLLIAVFLPKKEKPPKPMNLKEIIRVHINLLSNKVFMISCVCLSVLFGLIVCFNVIGPFVVQVQLHYSAVVFGYTATVMGICWLFGAGIKHFLVSQELSEEKIIFVSFVFLVVFAVIMFLLSWRIADLRFVVIFSGLIVMCGSIAYPNVLTQILWGFREHASIANGLRGSLNILGVSLTSLIAASLQSQAITALAGMYFLTGLIGILGYGLFLGAPSDK